MRVWKICRQPFAADALQGIGGLTTSGRWHHKGIPIVYTAGSPALAALKVLVPVDPLCAPADLRLLAIDLPPDLSMEVIDPGTRNRLAAESSHGSLARALRGDPCGAQHPAQSTPSRSNPLSPDQR
jgi:RES domain-containing protein